MAEDVRHEPTAHSALISAHDDTSAGGTPAGSGMAVCLQQDGCRGQPAASAAAGEVTPGADKIPVTQETYR
jgi:hypothetical protein